jgi:hypothetical protein
VIRLAVKDISVQGRATRGVRIMDLEEGDSVAALARIPIKNFNLRKNNFYKLCCNYQGRQHRLSHTTPKARFGPCGVVFLF